MRLRWNIKIEKSGPKRVAMHVTFNLRILLVFEARVDSMHIQGQDTIKLRVTIRIDACAIVHCRRLLLDDGGGVDCVGSGRVGSGQTRS